MATKTAIKAQITSPVVHKVTVKATREVFYLVPSDSVRGKCYQVKWHEQAQEWRCDCPARKPCKHERAIRELQSAQYKALLRREAEEAKAYDEYCDKILFPILDEIDQERKLAQQARAADRRQHGALNGNRAFSLLK